MTPTSSKKECSESDLLRDSLEKPVLNDFLSIFEACAQERTCDKPVKTFDFLRFFVGRRFFERTGLLERKTFKKSHNSTLWEIQNRPKSDKNPPKRIKNHSKNDRKRTRKPRGARKTSQEPPKSAQQRQKKRPRAPRRPQEPPRGPSGSSK